MNLYITFDSKDIIKKKFLNLRKYLIIDVDEILEKFGFSLETLTDVSYFIVNEEIRSLISTGANSKKFLGIVYSNPNFTHESIRETIHYAQTINSLHNVIFLTDKNTKEDFYELFEEVIFYPTLKKVHIINCIPLPIDWSDNSNIKN